MGMGKKNRTEKGGRGKGEKERKIDRRSGVQSSHRTRGTNNERKCLTCEVCRDHDNDNDNDNDGSPQVPIANAGNRVVNRVC